MDHRFPDGFLWGTAVSGFQTEAGASANGDDPNSDWWTWVHDAENVSAGRVSGDLPEHGPGSYDRYEADFDLALQLGNNAFRMGIEWSRIFPRSTRGVDASGGMDDGVMRRLDALADQHAVAHYRSVLEALRARRLVPFVTLNHFTLPLWIHDPIATRRALAETAPETPPPRFERPAGWLDGSIATEFAKYAAYVAWRYGDLVDLWAPINEPLVVASAGFIGQPGLGDFPPGAFNFRAVVIALANMVHANAAAYDAVKSWDRDDADGDGAAATVGLVQNLVAFTPADVSSAGDVEGARNADYLFNRLFIDAAVTGRVDVGSGGVLRPGERRAELAGKADFIGVNYYLRARVAGLPSPISEAMPVLDFSAATTYRSAEAPDAPECPSECTDMGWEVYPEGLREVLGIAGGYGLPVYITENGIADADDDQRANFLVRHLTVLQEAIAGGVADVRGYFHWSLVDNFEWSSGYGPSFGLCSYDRETLAREERPSADVYRRIARDNMVPAE
jgi:beta-galactosidase